MKEIECDVAVVGAGPAGLAAAEAAKTATYAKVRGALRDPVSFADPVMATCPTCHGAGQESRECQDCHGSGKCGNPSCDNGRTYLAMVGMVSCPRCGGSGRCKTCNASGKRTWPCQRCHKSGRVVNPDAAMRLFSEKLEAALGACRRNEVVPVSGAAGSGQTLAKATADALVQPAQKVLGPDGAAKQRLLGSSDKTVVKAFKVVDKGEDESGLFAVKVNALVVKELEAPSAVESGLGSPVQDSFDSGNPFDDNSWN